MCTFCARAVVRIDQFVVFCGWLVPFVCTWLLFSSLFDTCRAQKTLRVGMESINLCTFCARAVARIDQFVVFCCWLVLFVCTWLLFRHFLIRVAHKRRFEWGWSPLTYVPSVRGLLRVLISLSCLLLVSPICMYLAHFRIRVTRLECPLTCVHLEA